MRTVVVLAEAADDLNKPVIFTTNKKLVLVIILPTPPWRTLPALRSIMEFTPDILVFTGC